MPVTPDYRTGLEKRIDKLSRSINVLRTDIEEMEVPELKGILGRYAAAFTGFFSYWVAASKEAVKTPHAKKLLGKNLLEEIEGNHPQMLFDFVRSAGVLPEAKDFQDIDKEVRHLNKVFASLSPVKAAIITAVLEATAVDDMKYLAAIAKKLGSKNFTYTTVHGELDLEHTEELLQATESEMRNRHSKLRRGGIDPEKEIKRDIATAVSAVGRLLKKIIKPGSEIGRRG